MINPRSTAILLIAVALCACSPSHESTLPVTSDPPRLPTGAQLDPAGRSVDVGRFPLALALSPDGKRIAILLSGYHDNGLQILDRSSGRVLQTLRQPTAFLGLAFSPDGKRIYTSGGNNDVVYAYALNNERVALADSIFLSHKKGTRFPAGIGVSPDSRTVYVAGNLDDSLQVIDASSAQVTQRVATERYPYAVLVAHDGTVYVSAWGGSTVSVFRPSNGKLEPRARIVVGRHPSALALNHDESRLYVTEATVDQIAVVNTHSMKVIAQLEDPPPAGPNEGSTPNAIALSPDDRTLYVAEADNNAVAVFDLTTDKMVGRIPTQWYPSAIAATRDSLFVSNAKGRGTGPNPGGPNPIKGRGGNQRLFTLGQLSGTLTLLAAPSAGELAGYSARVARANSWTGSSPATAYPPIQHVIYVIKENRTYDQMLGDLKQADGDPSLLFFPRSNTPNHHALAERFGIYDRFFVNAEVSGDGHNWSTAAYASDYVDKTVPLQYAGAREYYDYEGTNRDVIVDDDVASPGTGYLWDLAHKAGISYRNYGEFVDWENAANKYEGIKPNLIGHTSLDYPGFDLDILDQHRADIWLGDLNEFNRTGSMPALEIVRLPNDHTAGAKGGSRTPLAMVADNDLALGRMIEGLSKSQFWKSTAVFVLEDDAQNGSDHVDSHRSPFLVISPWTKPGVFHRFANTTDVLATIEEILKLGHLSQFDNYGRPLRDIWASKPDDRPYVALKPDVDLEARNPKKGALADESRKLALNRADIANEDLFNRILWKQIKGNARYPGSTRLSGLEALSVH